MEKKFWTLCEAVRLLNVDEEFVTTLIREGIIESGGESGDDDGLLALSELEKIRVARVLVEDLDVNVPGIEVILRMRKGAIDMRNQFDQILACLVDEFNSILGRSMRFLDENK
jgi:MerR family transcriptional regulator, heat shock protein HspR